MSICKDCGAPTIIMAGYGGNRYCSAECDLKTKEEEPEQSSFTWGGSDITFDLSDVEISDDTEVTHHWSCNPEVFAGYLPIEQVPTHWVNGSLNVEIQAGTGLVPVKIEMSKQGGITYKSIWSINERLFSAKSGTIRAVEVDS